MEQQLKTAEEAERRGYTQEQYTELVRLAQEIRAEKEGRVSREVLAESAAEVGIREEDLREAEIRLREREQQREAERLAGAQRSRTLRLVGIAVAVLLALQMLFSFNSLNGQRLAVDQTRANLQSTIQRRADLVPQLTELAREGATREEALVQQLARVRAGLQSNDLGTQLRASSDLRETVQQAAPPPGSSTSGLYQDLIAELSGSENRISVARQRYTAAATAYNQSAQSFPHRLFRPLLGLPGSVPVEAGGR